MSDQFACDIILIRPFFFILGSVFTFKIICNEGHHEEFCNSTSIGLGRYKLYLINLSIICYSFLCGLHWDQLHSFFTKCGISLVSESTFYRYLKNLVYPVTYNFWLRDQASIINDLKEEEKASGIGSKFAGDGRFDSPGWSAKFCT